MPLGLIVGGPFSPLSRAISSRCIATVCFRAVTSLGNWTTSSLSWAADRGSTSGGVGINRSDRNFPAMRIPNHDPLSIPRPSVTFPTRFADPHLGHTLHQTAARSFAGITGDSPKLMF
jgi:hypothetical protein